MQSMKLGLLVVGGLLAAVGCAPTQLSKNYGESYYTMMEAQILNPEAGRTQDPVEGMDGKAAATTIEQYRKMFESRETELGRSMIPTSVQTK